MYKTNPLINKVHYFMYRVYHKLCEVDDLMYENNPLINEVHHFMYRVDYELCEVHDLML